MDIMNNNGIYSTPRASAVAIPLPPRFPSVPGQSAGLPGCRTFRMLPFCTGG